jgi:putative oxidoreductase
VGAVSFMFVGYQKLTGSPDMVALFAAIGVGQWFRLLTGTLEILGGIALLVPRLRALGAVGLVCVMVGALITDFSLGISPVPALVELVIAGLVAWGRRRELTLARILSGANADRTTLGQTSRCSNPASS